jgi:hypothetical protein
VQSLTTQRPDRRRRKRASVRGAAAAIALAVVASVAAPPTYGSQEARAVEVRIDAGAARAVLTILEKRRAGAAIGDVDWTQLFATAGYRRLKARELAMGREFGDAAFREFVMSGDLLARARSLAETLEAWERIDATAAARRALVYLPKGARIRATIFPVIKPRDNSFVFDVATDPAIFLYLDPKVAPEKFENTLAHELHHIGYGTACTSSEEAAVPGTTATARSAVRWMGAFGEGLAMLAAAGGPDVHPHATSPADERERWDADVARFNDDLRRVEQFLLDVAAGRLDEQQQREAAMAFYGVQGPWYTVGWRMSTVVERGLGRDRLVELSCDSVALLRAYNEVAARQNAAGGEQLALWSPELFASVGARRPR